MMILATLQALNYINSNVFLKYPIRVDNELSSHLIGYLFFPQAVSDATFG